MGTRGQIGDPHPHHGRGWRGWTGRLGELAAHHAHHAPGSHGQLGEVDQVLQGSREGMRAVRLSLLGLALTAAAQLAVFFVSGSVALLGDALHNLADSLTAVPLGLAFLVGRRPPSRRYVYGYGRAEDLAGLAVVATIAASSVAAGYESVNRLLHPQHVQLLGAVAAAAVLGFVGNEWVARFRITVGRRIGSASLVADGVHARTDGLTSLAVLVGAAGVAAGFRLADPIAGLAITVAIVLVGREAARDVFRRLMDAVEPELVDRCASVLGAVPGVRGVGDLRLRWIGHALWAEAEVVVSGELTVSQGHDIAEQARHALLHDVPRLTSALVHVDPADGHGVDHHAEVAHHWVPGKRPTP
jgi:cation diffusion facilitator family transporter